MARGPKKEVRHLSFKTDPETGDMLDRLVVHYQQGSISQVTKTDVLRLLVREKHRELFNNEENSQS